MAKFALFVSAVPGRLASRPGSPHSYIGAQLRSPEELKAGVSEPTWSPEVVVPVLEAEYDRFRREWDGLVRDGDVLKRTEAEFKSYTDALAATEKKRDEQLAEEAKKAEAAAKKKLKDEADAKASSTVAADAGGNR